MLHKISKNKKCAPRLIFFYENFFYKDSDDFWLWKLTLKIRFWHFLTAIFGHLTSLMKKSNPFLWSLQSYLQSEMFFFIKFHWHDEKLTYYTQGNLLHCHLNNVVAGFATNFAPLWNHKMNFIKLKKSYQKSGWNETWIFWYDFGVENQN